MRRLRQISAAIAMLAWLAAPVRADPPAAEPGALPPEITLPEFQGVSCLMGSTLGALAGWTYGEVFLASAVVGSSLSIVIPVVATAFVAGCGVASVMAPGLLWLYRRAG